MVPGVARSDLRARFVGAVMRLIRLCLWSLLVSSPQVSAAEASLYVLARGDGLHNQEWLERSLEAVGFAAKSYLIRPGATGTPPVLVTDQLALLRAVHRLQAIESPALGCSRFIDLVIIGGKEGPVTCVFRVPVSPGTFPKPLSWRTREMDKRGISPAFLTECTTTQRSIEEFGKLSREALLSRFFDANGALRGDPSQTLTRNVDFIRLLIENGLAPFIYGVAGQLSINESKLH